MGTMHELTQYPSGHSLGALEGCNLWSWRSWGWVKAIFMRSKMINHGILMDFGVPNSKTSFWSFHIIPNISHFCSLRTFWQFLHIYLYIYYVAQWHLRWKIRIIPPWSTLEAPRPAFGGAAFGAAAFGAPAFGAPAPRARSRSPHGAECPGSTTLCDDLIETWTKYSLINILNYPHKQKIFPDMEQTWIPI